MFDIFSIKSVGQNKIRIRSNINCRCSSEGTAKNNGGPGVTTGLAR